MDRKPLFLKIYKNGQLIEVKQFHQERIVLGSGNVDIHLEGLLPSHAVIQKEGNGLYHILILAGVEPGVFISGHQVWRYPLVSYGVFQIGYYYIEFWETLSQTASMGHPHPTAARGIVSEKTVTTTQTAALPFDENIQTQQPHSQSSQVPPPPKGFTQTGHGVPPGPPQAPVPPKGFTQTGHGVPSGPPQAPVSPKGFTQTGHGVPPGPPQAPVSPKGFTQTGHGVPSGPPQAPVFPETFTQTGHSVPPGSPQVPAPPKGFTQTGHSVPPGPPQAPVPPKEFTQTGHGVPPGPPQAPAPPGHSVPHGPPQAPVFPETFTQTGQAPPPGYPQAPTYPGAQVPGQTAPPSTQQTPPSSHLSSELEEEPYPDTATQVQQNLLHSIQSDISASSPFNLPKEVPESVRVKDPQQKQPPIVQKQSQPSFVQEKPSPLPQESVQVFSPQVQVSQAKEEVSNRQTIKNKSHRRKRTFTNNSHVRDINERIHPENGSVVKVIVAWNDKVLNTLYFDTNSTVRVGSHPKNDIVLPVFSHSKDSHSLIKIDNLASLFVTYDMKGVLVKGSERTTFDDIINSGAVSRQDTGFNINLQKGELARVDFDSGVSIFVKYTAPSPKPLIGPFFDFTSAELNTIIMAIGSSIIMAIFFLIAHEPEVVELEEEVERKAIFVYKPPPAPAIDPIPVKPPPPKPIKVKPKKVKKLAKKAKAPKAKTVTRQKRLNKKKTRVAQQRAKQGKKGGGRKARGRSKVASNNPAKNSRRPRKGINRGGGGGPASGRRNKKDVSKSGLLGAFAKGGQQDSLREAFDGAGVVENLAQRARGRGGGSGGGGRGGITSGGGLAAIGNTGKGESSYGIGGIKTKGRGGGGGIKGFGQGSLGGKLNVRVDVSGGDGESFEGVIDKEAIRRVVKRNVKQLRTCYERLAQRDPNASGRVDLNWTIGANGRVGSVKVVRSQIKDKRTLDCMKLRLAAWRFPDPPEGVIGDINYPFVFVVSKQ